MANETLLKFKYPESLIKEYDHWVVLLRPAQVTIGSLVLASPEDATRFPDLSPESFTELKKASGDMEAALSASFGQDKINYLMLMMVDPHVHYHVIPRYAGTVRFDGGDYRDPFWPGPPDVTHALDLSGGQLAAIQERLKGNWPT